MNTWTPAPYRARLGQTSFQKTAQAIVEEAEPKLRRVIADERGRIVDAADSALPFLGLSAAAYLGTAYLAPDGVMKPVGYGASAVLLAVGILRGLAMMDQEEEAAPAAPEPKTGLIGDVIGTLVDPASRKMATAIVAEAVPAVQGILVDERALVADAVQTAVPFIAVAVAVFLGTAYLVPETMPMAKMGGYLAAAGGGLFGLYRGAEKVRGESAPPQEVRA